MNPLERRLDRMGRHAPTRSGVVLIAMLALPALLVGCDRTTPTNPPAPRAPSPSSSPPTAPTGAAARSTPSEPLGPSTLRTGDTGATAPAGQRAAGASVSASSLYPYVIPADYPAAGPSAPPGFERSIGHGLRLMLVRWNGQIVESLLPADLRQLGVTPDEAFARAITNLKAHVSSSEFSVTKHQSAGGVAFLAFEGHLASSAVALDDLFAFCRRSLGADRMVVCVPQRDAMVVFPACSPEQERSLMEMVRANESDAPKPLTFELFELDARGLRPRP